MLILAIGDPHFKVDNTEESEHFSQQVKNWLIQNKVDFIIILGDILHSHEKIFTFAMNTAVNFITMCSEFAPTYCLVGNHDATSNTIFCGTNHWLNVLKNKQNVIVVDKPTNINSSIVCCPYVSDGRFVEMLDLYVEDWKDLVLIFAHQLFDGVQMGAILAENVEEWKDAYPLVISGHIHDRQQVQKNLYYVGSSQQLAFSERGDKSLALVTVEGKRVHWKEIFLNLKERKTMYVSLEELTSLNLKTNIQYKIVVKDDDSAIKAFKKTSKYKDLLALPNVKSVQFKPNIEEEKEEQSSSTNDFVSILVNKVNTEGDLYLQSYAKHLISGSEDLSDKDVILL